MTNNEELEGYALLIQVIGQGRRPKEERMGRGACATRPRTRGMITAEAETGVARLQDQDWTWIYLSFGMTDPEPPALVWFYYYCREIN